MAGTAVAQHSHNHHPAKDQAIHEAFYSKWMRPDDDSISCCNLQDCYPVEARKTPTGSWQFLRREDSEWIDVPESKIERVKDNPDGRNHVCAPPPPATFIKVYCFSIGGGI
jgi:hypothetical protein